MELRNDFTVAADGGCPSGGPYLWGAMLDEAEGEMFTGQVRSR